MNERAIAGPAIAAVVQGTERPGVQRRLIFASASDPRRARKVIEDHDAERSSARAGNCAPAAEEAPGRRDGDAQQVAGIDTRAGGIQSSIRTAEDHYLGCR
ncbi:MAG: hypothetical protein IPK44_25115 [Candidatus Accumulibacter sp.]|uniref:hypothetical protein n=1 Tax=Accumulibacter sp. TaxID=2053492 RepID=UPI00258B0121|nr:hypothetical protein [Accumulibacter sp.]MBK8117570.1 hypothetical protein [Accumulibacter sp.]